jgi:nicotinate-nucleotide pyrophosphorylase (carboxylating)
MFRTCFEDETVTMMVEENEILMQNVQQNLLPVGCTFSVEELFHAAEPLIKLAVREDAPRLDMVDARLILDQELRGVARILANSAGVFAGGWLCPIIARHYDPNLEVKVHVRDGSEVKGGELLVTITGLVASIVTAERIFLNFLSRISGIASLTHRCVQACAGTIAVVTDTRKTLPGYRVLDKYGVQAGGGKNHRMHLCDGVMIKDNHISAMRDITISQMVQRVRDSLKKSRRNIPIWVEIDRLDQLSQALDGRPDVILLDNMSLQQMRTAVQMRNDWFSQMKIKADTPSPLLEASGGVDLSNIGDVARTGVDRIAVGALTHSAPALDLTLELIPDGMTKPI